MLQLYLKSTFMLLATGYLIDKEKEKALESLIFLEGKRDGHIKGWACTDSINQWLGASKEYATSPTVSLKTVIITSFINACEGRGVSIVNVSRDLLTEDQYEIINITLRGKLAKIMVNTDP